MNNMRGRRIRRQRSTDRGLDVEPLEHRQRDQILRRAPAILEWYRSLKRPQYEPMMRRASGPGGSGIVLVIDDQLGGYLHDRDSNPSIEGLEILLGTVASLVEVAARHHAALGDEALERKVEDLLRQDELVPPGPLRVKRFPHVPRAGQVIALCSNDPDAHVIDKGLFGQPRHVRDGYAPGEAGFIHPAYGDDPVKPPTVLSLSRDLVPLFSGLAIGEEGHGIVFVDSSTGVKVDVPTLSPETVHEAVTSYWRNGVYSAGTGRDSYKLTRGATGTLIFSAPYGMDLRLAVALASAWSLAANKGNFFLQGGRSEIGEHRYFLTP